MTPITPRFFPALVAAVTLLGAFLLFQVQPLFGRAILPWFGGSPAVWTTCMLFFQLLLVAGYAYADRVVRLRAPWMQTAVHSALLLACLPLLPIGPSVAWKPVDGESPMPRIMLLLAACVGLPYFVLSATGPLVGAWVGRMAGVASPFRLYALSNLGSLLGLLAYPFVVEPLFDVPRQSLLWSAAFAVFAVLLAAAGWTAALAAPGRPDCGLAPRSSEPASAADARIGVAASSRRAVVAWILLPALASAAFLSVTNHLCRDVTVVPFLWVAPFVAYLASFILCFDHAGWYRRPAWAVIAIIAGFLVCATLLAGRLDAAAETWGFTIGASTLLRRPLVEAAIHIGWLFAACMLLHGELVRLAPGARRLTSFYLAIAVGGGLGGCFVAVVCPWIFSSYWEYQLSLGAVGLIGFAVTGGVAAGRSGLRNSSRRLVLTLPAVAWAAAWLWSLTATLEPNIVHRDRNFYGVLTIKEHNRGNPLTHGLGLYHGRILHGYQFLDPVRRRDPTTYYGPESLPDIVMASLRTMKANVRVGVVGLGAGTLAAYGREGDVFRFYEIDPLVIEAQGRFFHFLEDCPADTSIEFGDARICMERQEPQRFDALFIDAFSGDAVPAHLLTREALAVYRRHLTPQGFVAFHITNQFLDLAAVVAGLARDAGLQTFSVRSNVADVIHQARSEWTVILQNPANESGENQRAVLWTDRESSLWEILR
jgi:hypothetical protein